MRIAIIDCILIANFFFKNQAYPMRLLSARTRLGYRNTFQILNKAGTVLTFLALIGMIFGPSAQATQYFWDTTTTGLWTTGTNWSLTSTGTPAGTVAPTSSITADTAVFNGSGVNGNEIVQLRTGASTTVGSR